MDFDNYNQMSAGSSTNEWIQYPAQASEQGNNLNAEFAMHLNKTRPAKTGNDGERASMHEGSIANAQLDKSWKLTETENNAFLKLQSFSAPGDNSTTISFHDSQIPVNAAAAQSLKQMFANNSDRAHDLSRDEIRSIASILDRLNAGDNQHTNSAKLGDRGAPLFQLDKCQIHQIGGKSVLQVEGNFIKPDGTPGQVLKGILMSSESNPQQIQAIAFEAADKQMLSKHQAAYDSMLNSIRWTKK